MRNFFHIQPMRKVFPHPPSPLFIPWEYLSDGHCCFIMKRYLTTRVAEWVSKKTLHMPHYNNTETLHWHYSNTDIDTDITVTVTVTMTLHIDNDMTVNWTDTSQSDRMGHQHTTRLNNAICRLISVEINCIHQIKCEQNNLPVNALLWKRKQL